MRVGLAGALVSPITCPSGSVGLSWALVSPITCPSGSGRIGIRRRSLRGGLPVALVSPITCPSCAFDDHGVPFGRNGGLASLPIEAHRESGSNGPCPSPMTCDGWACECQKSVGCSSGGSWVVWMD